MTERPHRWHFIRAGGVDQVVIRSGADVVALPQLDQKLWVALACPTRGVEMDERTLDLIDTDGDGRIRPPELIAVSRWVAETFADPDVLLAGGDRVLLTSIRTDTEEGRTLADEARAVLRLIGRPEADAIALADLDTRRQVLAGQGFNGDGVVPASAAEFESTARLIELIIATVGAVADENGKPGVDAERSERFFAQADALHDWRQRALDDASLRPLGADSRAAAEALLAVRDKVDDFFLRCRIAAYDAASAAPLSPNADDYRALGAGTLAAASDALLSLPLATAAPGRALPLREGLNPAWSERIAALRVHAAEALLGRPLAALSEADWQALLAQLGPVAAWLAERPPTPLDAQGAEALAELRDPALRARLARLVERDAEAAPANPRVIGLERLMRYQRDLVHLLNNFVSFSEFYSRRGAIFQAGTLYLDERSCELVVAVGDVAAHTKLAGLAKAYLAYCDCVRGERKMTVVAAFTAGDVDYLFAGRNGVFYDRKGDDWDARITKVIENPMSVRQAFFLPYKKVVRMVDEQIAKRAAAAEQKAQGGLGGLGGLATRVVQVDKGAKPAAAAADAKAVPGVDVGTVAAIGVALGSISTVVVAVFGKFVELGWWIPVALLCIMLAISGPSMLIAWLKLRQRSLGPILDASGWAINGRMRISVPLGRSLTQTASLPAGSLRSLDDPYTAGRAGTLAWLLLALLAALALAAWTGAIGGLGWGR